MNTRFRLAAAREGRRGKPGAEPGGSGATLAAPRVFYRRTGSFSTTAVRDDPADEQPVADGAHRGRLYLRQDVAARRDQIEAALVLAAAHDGSEPVKVSVLAL